VRYGGDEFVVLLEQVEGVEDVQPILERIRAAFAESVSLAEGDVTLSASVGVAMGPGSFRTPEEVLAAADRAMYAAKRGNR
jgi:diguanylate cyclase (GGDEF)-like protein